MPHSYLWLDLETTGLDPNKCRILEWAAVLAADDREGDMSVVEQFSDVIGFGCAVEGADFSGLRAAQAEMDPFVTDMHTDNGLIAECINSTSTLAEAEQFLVDLVTDMGAGKGQIVLAGSTVAFDLSFLRVHMPRFAHFLSHRCFDVSTLKMAERDWAGQPFKKAEAHRALPDVLESLAHAAEIRRRHGELWNAGDP
jgi:oligoribonuclease